MNCIRCEVYGLCYAVLGDGFWRLEAVCGVAVAKFVVAGFAVARFAVARFVVARFSIGVLRLLGFRLRGSVPGGQKKKNVPNFAQVFSISLSRCEGDILQVY